MKKYIIDESVLNNVRVIINKAAHASVAHEVVKETEMALQMLPAIAEKPETKPEEKKEQKEAKQEKVVH